MNIVDQERRLFRWGGLAGMLGSGLYLVVFVVVGVLIGSEPTNLERVVTRFPEIRAARTVEDGLYLVVLVLWIPLFLAMYRALRGANLASALLGAVLGVAGVVVLAVGALPHVVYVRLSDLYNATAATPQDQATVALLWQLMLGINDMLVIVGFFLVPAGILFLGVAMFRAPAFGRRTNWTTVALGVAGVATAAMLVIDPLAVAPAFVNVLAQIVFPFVVAKTLFTLSGTSAAGIDAPAGESSSDAAMTTGRLPVDDARDDRRISTAVRGS